jgi:hypothetical protein
MAGPIRYWSTESKDHATNRARSGRWAGIRYSSTQEQPDMDTSNIEDDYDADYQKDNPLKHTIVDVSYEPNYYLPSRAPEKMTSPDGVVQTISKVAGVDPNYARHVLYGNHRSEKQDHQLEVAANQISDDIRAGKEPEEWAVSHVKSHPSLQPKLFHEIPATMTVVGAFSHSRMAHTVPTIIAKAHLDFGKPDIIAGDSLSSHSSSLAKSAQHRGVPVYGHESNKGMIANNKLDFDDINYAQESYPEFHNLTGIYKEIPKEGMKEARSHLRNMLRGNRPPKAHMSQQFDQPQLPGMEDY